MLSQVIFNGVVAGSLIALLAISFALVYSTTRFFNFGHGIPYLLGSYTAHVVISTGGYHPLLGLVVATATGAATGVLLDVFLFHPLRARGAAPHVSLLASIGAMVIVQSVIALVFGEGTLLLRDPAQSDALQLGPVRATMTQLVIVGVGTVAPGALSALLEFTRWGTTVRAVANNAELATIVGLPTRRVFLLTFGLGSALAAAASVLSGYYTDLTPMMGFHAVLYAMVAAIVGGAGSVPGAALGGWLVGLAQHIGALVLPTQWQHTSVFLLLIGFLVLRPHGFLGRRSRVGAA